MTRHVVLLSAAGLVLVLSACGRSPSSSSPSPAPPGKPGAVAKAPTPEGAPSAASTTGDLQLPPPSQAQYETKGRRDPFEIPGAREGAASTTVASAKLAGIIRTAGGSALALIETSEGLGYILRTGDTLGDGQLVEIDQNSVVFSVASRATPVPNRVVLRLVSE